MSTRWITELMSRRYGARRWTESSLRTHGRDGRFSIANLTTKVHKLASNLNWRRLRNPARPPDYMKKHLVKAGITGWAQVNGWRGNTDLAKRIEHDLYYIENWSLALDLKIMFLTLFKGMIHENAY